MQVVRFAAVGRFRIAPARKTLSPKGGFPRIQVKTLRQRAQPVVQRLIKSAEEINRELKLDAVQQVRVFRDTLWLYEAENRNDSRMLRLNRRCTAGAQAP